MKRTANALGGVIDLHARVEISEQQIKRNRIDIATLNRLFEEDSKVDSKTRDEIYREIMAIKDEMHKIVLSYQRWAVSNRFCF